MSARSRGSIVSSRMILRCTSAASYASCSSNTSLSSCFAIFRMSLLLILWLPFLILNGLSFFASQWLNVLRFALRDCPFRSLHAIRVLNGCGRFHGWFVRKSATGS